MKFAMRTFELMSRLIQFLTLTFLFISSVIWSQQEVISAYREAGNLPFIQFQASPNQQFGFDSLPHPAWKKHYERWNLPLSQDYYITYKSVGEHAVDLVEARIFNAQNFKRGRLKFIVNDSIETTIPFRFKNDSVLTIALPAISESYMLKVLYNSTTIGKLNVRIYPKKHEKVVIVPLLKHKISKDSLEQFLNTVFLPANIQFDVDLGGLFQTEDFDSATVFDNPGLNYDHYTQQMRTLRDIYFETFPQAEKRAYYLFLIPSFVDAKISGFQVRNKAIGFIRYPENDRLFFDIAKNIARGCGMLTDSWIDDGPNIGETDNLMDTAQGTRLTHFQWDALQNSTSSYSFYDFDEDVKTNNGMVAYYFWEEDENGYISMLPGNILGAIKRPYKKNYLSFHLNIKDILFRPIYAIGKYFICAWHILLFALIWLVVWYTRSKIRKHFEANLRKSRIWSFMVRSSISIFGVLLTVFMFFTINSQLTKNEITTGYIEDLNGQDYKEAQHSILYNKNLKRANEEDMSSEILLKRGDDWYMKRRKKVLYFEVRQDTNNQWSLCKFKSDSDTLIVVTAQYRKPAMSHYFVVNYIDANGYYDHQKVFNHAGNNITERLLLDNDPAKRILVFVNGYRPTSLGRTFEDNFADIRKNGLEFPKSRNLIFNFDRYDYWRPWQQIDLKIQKRINPSETFYADGHFSVSTSNHRSLLNFTSLSNKYPKRCPNPENHTCHTTDAGSSRWFGPSRRKTAEILPNKPNKAGFYERRENGRIAGKNLLQLLNEVPNKSSNDTLFIIAHSMGYAYALGMLDELRGNIELGEFYVIAPENGESGEVNHAEWQHIWQYGCDHDRLAKRSPCMLDGVAPQTKIGDLNKSHSIYIPDKYYKRHGFFDSHFIGFYTWILDIPEGEAGHIKQR